MIAVVLVMLLGAGICALGVVQLAMYFVGVVIWFIGAVGLLVWAGERAGNVLRRLRQ